MLKSTVLLNTQIYVWIFNIFEPYKYEMTN